MSGKYTAGAAYLVALLSSLLPSLAVAQGTATVHIQGVGVGIGLGEHSIPTLSNLLLITLAVCLMLIAVLKLRTSGQIALAVLGATLALTVANSPQLVAASGLDIDSASPACQGRSVSITFDPYSAQSLNNQCEDRSLRISGYELPCVQAVSGAGAGSVLKPGESLTLQQCSADNMPPTFTLSTTAYTIAEDAGPQILNNWLSALSPGPADESSQTVSTALNNDNAGLFSAAPALQGNNLAFTPADDAFGEARITLTATDSDGAISWQTLLLTITPVNDPPTAPNPTVSRTINGYEDTAIIVYLQAEDDGDFTFSLARIGEGLAGQFYFPRVDSDMSTRISESVIDLGGTSDFLSELFTPVSVVELARTRFDGFSDEFRNGFVFAFVPDDQVNGSLDLDVVFEDEGGLQSAPTAYSILVTAMNDAPIIKQGGTVVAGDSKRIFSYNNSISGDPYEQADPLEIIGLPASTTRGDFKPLGLSFNEPDYSSDSSLPVKLKVSTTLPASGGSGIDDYGDCAVSMVADDGRVLVFNDVYENSYPYTEARRVLESLAVNCLNGPATGEITVDLEDVGFIGVCPPGHPENYPEEDVAASGCSRNSQVVLDVTFAD